MGWLADFVEGCKLSGLDVPPCSAHGREVDMLGAQHGSPLPTRAGRGRTFAMARSWSTSASVKRVTARPGLPARPTRYGAAGGRSGVIC